jgi:plastocyanin
VRRILLLAASCAVAAVVFAATSLGESSATTTLRGTVGPGFTITLTSGGKKVTRVKPGMYRITVSDRSASHNFVLEKSGGGFERSITSVPFRGTKTATVRLTTGRWEFYCAPHEATMKGHLAVGNARVEDDGGDDNGGGKG